MRRQANDRKSSMEKGQNIAKKRKLALRLLMEGNSSLRDIAQITNVDKSTLSRICKCLRNNDYVALEKMLCPSTYKRGASTVLPSEEETVFSERPIMPEREGLLLGMTL